MEEIILKVNGKEERVQVAPEMPLLLVLRNLLRLTGAKMGCGLEQCGSCAVLVDGVSTLTCAAPVGVFVGKEIETVEGLAGDGTGNNVQQVFAVIAAAQCGYCTPGMVISATSLLRKSPSASEAEVREALMPHLCRCGSQPRILRAITQLIKDGESNGKS